MDSELDLSEFCCLNEDCPDYGKKGKGNMRVKERYGPKINQQDIQFLLSVATRPDQVESINSWISGICKDYPGIIPLGAMHPEHPDPEAETCGCGNLEYKE
jgi:hypothetical protein